MANVRIWGITTGVPALTDVMELQRTADGASLKATVAAIAAILPLPAAPGVDTEVLFNDATAIGAHAGLKYSKTTNTLTLGVASSATGILKLAQASSAFLTTIQAGAALAARTYIWPTDFGSAGYVLTDAAGDGVLSWAAGGGGGTPGGSDTQVQFNDGGSAFGGNAGFTFDKTTVLLSSTYGKVGGPNYAVDPLADGRAPFVIGTSDTGPTRPLGALRIFNNNGTNDGYGARLETYAYRGTISSPTPALFSSDDYIASQVFYNWGTTGGTPQWCPGGVLLLYPTADGLTNPSGVGFGSGWEVQWQDDIDGRTQHVLFQSPKGVPGLWLARHASPTIFGGIVEPTDGNFELRLALTSTNVTSTSFKAATLSAGEASAVTGAITLAHASSAFLTTIQAGNAAAARTYTWPTNFGAAGSVLTDAAGNGTLSWAAAGGSGTVSTVSVVAANGFSGSVANPTTTPAITLTMQNAAADGATKGIAAFTASDFDATSGVISLDYTNAQKATASVPGFLTAADWSTFNSKQAALTLGTGVSTALAVNVGSAGAFVTFNGALGTPSSGTLTNATGLPAAGVVGTAAVLGANTFTGAQQLASGTTLNWNNDMFLTRSAAAVLQHGDANAASPVAQTVQAQGSRSGTDTNVAGANFTIASGNGTGNATGSSLIFQTPTAVASGSSAQTMTTRLSLAAAGLTFTGLANMTGVTSNNNIYFGFGTGGSSTGWVTVGSGTGYLWSSTSSSGGSVDTGFARNAAGVVEVNNGTAGTFRDIKARNGIFSDANGAYLQTPGMAVANLPASPVRGMRCYVTDSNAASFTAGIGAVVAAGGSTIVPVFYDGTNWRIG